MSRHKLSKRLLTLSAAVSLLLCQSAFADEAVELNLQDAMERAFNTNPAITIAGYERDSARANYNAARQSRGITISASHNTQRGGYDDDQYTAVNVIESGELTQRIVNAGKGIHNSHANAITASLPIYTGGKLQGTIKQAKASYLYYQEGVQKAYNDMRSTVTTGYFDMLQAGNMQDRKSVV